MKAFPSLLLAGTGLITLVTGNSIGEEPRLDRPRVNIPRQLRAVPSDDEPEKLIRYLRGQNAVLQKERDELRAEVCELQRRLEMHTSGRVAPSSGVPATIDRQMIPIHFRYGLPVRGLQPLDEEKTGVRLR